MANRRGGGDIPKKGVTANDVAAGGGAGGLLVFAINTWVSDPNYQNVLIYLVPAASILVTGVYGWLIDLVTTSVAYRSAKRSLTQAKTHLAEIEADKFASAQHKKEARESVEQAERAVMLLNLRAVLAKR